MRIASATGGLILDALSSHEGFGSLPAPISTTYKSFLEAHFAEWYIVTGQDVAAFTRLLDSTWTRKKDLVTRYIEIFYSIRPKWKRELKTVTLSEDHSTHTSKGKQSDVAIDSQSNPLDDVPTTTSSGSAISDGQTSASNMTEEDGRIEDMDAFLKKFKTIEDLLVEIFEPCFTQFEGFIYP